MQDEREVLLGIILAGKDILVKKNIITLEPHGIF